MRNDEVVAGKTTGSCRRGALELIQAQYEQNSVRANFGGRSELNRWFAQAPKAPTGFAGCRDQQDIQSVDMWAQAELVL